MVLAPEAVPEIAPSEPHTTMKPSEAMRLGAMSSPQGFGRISDVTTGATCAIGALLIGYGWDGKTNPYSHRVAAWSVPGLIAAQKIKLPLGPGDRLPLHLYRPSREFRYEPCPVRGCSAKSGPRPRAVIIHLNDDHQWPRNKIADWLESIGL